MGALEPWVPDGFKVRVTLLSRLVGVGVEVGFTVGLGSGLGINPGYSALFWRFCSTRAFIPPFTYRVKDGVGVRVTLQGSGECVS